MELPRRARGDELLRPGELIRLPDRLHSVAARHLGAGADHQKDSGLGSPLSLPEHHVEDEAARAA